MLNFLKSIFISPNEARLRAGWRVLIQMAAMGGVYIVLLALFLFLVIIGVPYNTGLMLNQIIIFIAINMTVPLARRFLDKRSFVSLGLSMRLALPDLFFGFVIAGVMMNVIFVAEQLMGWASIESVAWQTTDRVEIIGQLALWLGIFVLAGWQEELLTRGYWLQNIADGTNLPAGVLLSSVLFAALHLSNPNLTVLSLVGLVAAGLFLAYGYILTKQLWLPIGLHIGWNFFEGNVFGFPVSGLDTFRLITLRVHGPDLWTGGAFGPEAGLILFPALLVGVGLMAGYHFILRERLK
jgi:uncharacterized protein